MRKDRRARIIVDHVMAKNERWGRNGPPRSSSTDIPSRIISDNCQWHARVSRGYQKDTNGEMWDLFELFAHGEQRLTVALKGDEMELRYFIPGSWETMFNIFNCTDSTPLLPN